MPDIDAKEILKSTHTVLDFAIYPGISNCATKVSFCFGGNCFITQYYSNPFNTRNVNYPDVDRAKLRC